MPSRITDAFVAANDHLTFCGKKMSEAIGDMDAYIQLTDEVFQQILHSTEDEMQKVHSWFVLVLNLTCAVEPLYNGHHWDLTFCPL